MKQQSTVHRRRHSLLGVIEILLGREILHIILQRIDDMTSLLGRYFNGEKRVIQGYVNANEGCPLFMMISSCHEETCPQGEGSLDGW
ncbi:hypothetical protein C1H69_00065 [Billgrantia endophytica]|uniref:Uncharacterized protein n=1 Tax=Billgrantia endophytica TaxID=2033802 RepID=A0A2N7UE49_9GAMM|nr:hypothetical protein C1H69_00065 [Halomonas endophytica]